MSFTHVCSYYDQPHLAELWWNNLMDWDVELSDAIDFVFVDDGSPKSPLEIPEWVHEQFNVRHFRIDVDIPWNDMGARNLGMKHAHGWALCMDADYIIRAEMAKKFLAEMTFYKKENIYQPMARIWKKTEFLHEPINKYMIHADRYWEIGGYPEQYAGHYGFSDTEFLRTHTRLGGQCVRERQIYIDHFPNGHVTWLDRDQGHNAKLLHQRMNIEANMPPGALQKNNLICNFPWREVTCV